MREKLQTLPLVQLRELAKAQGIKGVTALKKAELILEERQKNFIYYRLNTSVFEEMMLWIAQFSDRKEEGKENEK